MLAQWKSVLFSGCLGLLGGLLGAVIALWYLPPRISVQDVPVSPPYVSPSSSFPFAKVKSIADNLVFFVNSERGIPYVSISESGGVGFALTSDGLVATAAPVSVSARQAVTFDRTIHDTQRIVDKRGVPVVIPDAGLTLVKVLNASLKVVPFASYERLNVGDTLISFDQKGAPRLHHLVLLWDQAVQVDRVEGSEELSSFFQVDGEPGAAGNPIYTMQGELVGVFDSKGRIVPGPRIAEAVGRYINRGTVKKTFLGAHFVNLNTLIPTTLKSGVELPKEGLLLKDGRAGKAVVKGSPAQVAGLKAGDILLALEGQRLNDGAPFQFLLQRYRPGTEVEFLIVRDKAEQKIKVVLGEE